MSNLIGKWRVTTIETGIKTGRDVVRQKHLALQTFSTSEIVTGQTHLQEMCREGAKKNENGKHGILKWLEKTWDDGENGKINTLYWNTGLICPHLFPKRCKFILYQCVLLKHWKVVSTSRNRTIDHSVIHKGISGRVVRASD